MLLSYYRELTLLRDHLIENVAFLVSSRSRRTPRALNTLFIYSWGKWCFSSCASKLEDCSDHSETLIYLCWYDQEYIPSVNTSSLASSGAAISRLAWSEMDLGQQEKCTYDLHIEVCLEWVRSIVKRVTLQKKSWWTTIATHDIFIQCSTWRSYTRNSPR